MRFLGQIILRRVLLMLIAIMVSTSSHSRCFISTKNTSNPKEYEQEGMDYIVLEKNIKEININGETRALNILTQEMVSKSNTVYVIRYGYYLKEEITIPKSCVLEFDGGYLKNGSVKFQDTYIQSAYIPIFEDVSLKGSIKNEAFNALWIRAKDIGESINKTSVYFDKIFVPYNNYSFVTPILIKNARKLDLEGTYTYDGSLYNGLVLVKLDRCGSTQLNIGNVTISEKLKRQMDYRDERTQNIIGVNLKDTGSSRLYVRSVQNLNEGIRVSCSNTQIGGGDNFIDANLLFNNNIGIRIYQENSKEFKSPQFVNDTHIHVNYCTSRLNSTKYGIFIGGPLSDPVSYRARGVKDNYDYCSGVVLDGGDYEDVDVGVYCRNAEISIENVREENIPIFIKAVGKMKLHYQPKYINAINKIDLTECTNFTDNGLPSAVIEFRRDLIPLRKGVQNSDSNYVCSYNYHIMKSSCVASNEVRSNEVEGIGFVISDFTSKIIKLATEKNARLVVAYLDPYNNNISKDYKKPSDSFYLTKGIVYMSNTMTNNQTIIVPQGITKLFLGVALTSSTNKCSISCYSNASLDDNPTPLSGEVRPSALPLGISFYDEKIKKPIWWSGNTLVGDKGWIDSNGNRP